MKAIFKAILFVITGASEWVRDVINAGAVDLSGQGRDKYGK